MRLFIACLGTETNTFAPIPTGRRSFEDVLYTRNASREPPTLFSAPLVIWRQRAEALGWDVVESLSAFAQPAGTTLRAAYEGMRDEILGDLAKARPVDAVLISMHGAMVAEGYDDCEGDLLARVRAIAGPNAFVGGELDPHCHLTEQMLTSATALICFKEYPHIDTPERAEELFTLCRRTLAGEIKPVMRDYDCRMIGTFLTPFEPMRGFVDAMSAAEGRDGVLSLSLAHGFPWADVPRVGARMLAIVDGNAEQAATVARAFGERLWSIREGVRARFPKIGAALERAVAANGFPIVLADYADNAGGGAPSDATFMLKDVLARGIKNAALGIFWDPTVYRLCSEAGVGATLPIRLGGKVGPMSGDPIDLVVTVRGHGEKLFQMMGKTRMPMGNAVWLEADGVHLIVNDQRTQVFDPAAFTALGLDLSQMKIVVVKSSQHFYDRFAPIAAEVIHVATPGAITPDFANIPYTRRDPNYWPRVENPFA